MNEQEQPKPKRRVRNLRPDIRLLRTIAEAEDACRENANATKLALINTRLQITWSMVKRAESGKLVKALKRVAELEAECTRLKELLAQPRPDGEVERLRLLIQTHAPAGGNNENV